MPDPERNSLRELSKALHDLAQHLHEASHALDRLQIYLDAVTGDAYERHGQPFGPGGRSAYIWLSHKQYTTSN